jgi:hypothetical protein
MRQMTHVDRRPSTLITIFPQPIGGIPGVRLLSCFGQQWVEALPSACWNRKKKPRYSKALYKQGQNIAIMFGRIKDWRRIAMRYDCWAHTFCLANCLAATFILYLNE